MSDPASAGDLLPSAPARVPALLLSARAATDVLLLVLIAFVLGAVLMALGTLAGVDIGRDDNWPLEMLTSGVFIAGLLLLQRFLPLPAFVDPPRVLSTTKAVLIGLAAGAGMLLFDSAAQWVLERAGITVDPANEQAIRDTLTVAPVAGMLMFGLLAPVVEEWLLRYRLFGRFWRGGRPWLGVVLTSAFFALLHEFGKDPGQSWSQWSVLIALYAYAGVLFALLYRYTGRLVAAITAHAVNNSVLCVAMLAGWL